MCRLFEEYGIVALVFVGLYGYLFICQNLIYTPANPLTLTAIYFTQHALIKTFVGGGREGL